MDLDSVSEVFWVAKSRSPGSYKAWGDKVMGGTPVLLRHDGRDDERLDQLSFDPDSHPCQGTIYFGDIAQESKQLAAFCKLRDPVVRIFKENKPTKVQREATSQRAKQIIAKAGCCFMPGDGYCSCCGGRCDDPAGDYSGR